MATDFFMQHVLETQNKVSVFKKEDTTFLYTSFPITVFKH